MIEGRDPQVDRSFVDALFLEPGVDEDRRLSALAAMDVFRGGNVNGAVAIMSLIQRLDKKEKNQCGTAVNKPQY